MATFPAYGSFITYQELVSRGYKDGFAINWSASPSPGTDSIRQNTAIIKTSSDRGNNLNGFKFMYKVGSQIDWVLLYIHLYMANSNPLPSNYASYQTHNYNNMFYLSVNGTTIIDGGNIGIATIYTQNDQYVCEVMRSGSIALSAISDNKFNVQFSYANRLYYDGVSAASFCTNWGANFTYSSSDSAFRNQWFKSASTLYNGYCQLSPEEDAIKIYQSNGTTQITDGKVSYGQTIIVNSTGNQVSLANTGYSAYDDVWKDGQFTYNLTNIQSPYPSTIKAQAKFRG